jgi:hypothetical protein
MLCILSLAYFLLYIFQNESKEINMKLKKLKLTLAGLIISVCSLNSNAGIIDASSVLLDDAGATQLENWLGQGDQDWDSVWYGTAGATGATSVLWHGAVDGIANTVSIYDITYAGQNYKIGGYNANAWSSTSEWAHDYDGTWENFIFNLTTNVKAQTTDPLSGWVIGQYATVNDTTHFATFGGGYDLHGGRSTLGAGMPMASHGGTYVGEKDGTIGNIVDGSSTSASLQINALETFTFRPATEVPAPSTLAIFALGMIGLASRRFKKQS